MSEGRELKINVDGTKTLEAFKVELDAKNEAINQAKEFERRLNEEKSKNAHLEEQLTKGGGIGVLPNSLNGNSEGGSGATGIREWNSFEEMVDELRARKDHADKEVLQKLMNKGILAFKSHPQSFEIKDEWKDGKSCVAHVLDAQNKRVRRE